MITAGAAVTRGNSLDEQQTLWLKTERALFATQASQSRKIKSFKTPKSTKAVQRDGSHVVG